MKHIFSKLALLLLLAVPASKVSAQHPTMKLCLKDNCGYMYNVTFTNTSTECPDYYVINGTVDIGNGNTWEVHGYLDESNDSLEYTIVNPNANGGQSGLADSCMYCGHGCGFHDQNRNGNVVFEGTGYWVAYVNGQVNSTALFSVEDCDHDASIQPMMNPLRVPMTKDGAVTSLTVTPNPVNTSATIQYTVATPAKVNITIYNYLQQPVKTIVSEMKQAGTYTSMWNGRYSNGTTANSGLYKVVVVADGKTSSTTMQVVH